MIEMHSKCDNMHENEMFYALIYINNHIIVCINCVLSTITQILNCVAIFLISLYFPRSTYQIEDWFGCKNVTYTMS